MQKITVFTYDMKITIEDLQNRFAEYNRLYFHGSLKMPRFKIGKWSYGSIHITTWPR